MNISFNVSPFTSFIRGFGLSPPRPPIPQTSPKNSACEFKVTLQRAIKEC